MSDYYNAFEMSPVPAPGPDAVPPEPFRGIYGMPAFVTIPTSDFAASVDFWIRGLGFFELFSIPGRVVHLRRWRSRTYSSSRRRAFRSSHHARPQHRPRHRDLAVA